MKIAAFLKNKPKNSSTRTSKQQGCDESKLNLNKAPESLSPQELKAVSIQKQDLNILVAEDNFVNQMIVKQQLKLLGYNCHIVENGQQAIDALEKERYDLILMDIHMPEMTGLEASQHIRAELKLNTPIVALTAQSFSCDSDCYQKAGMNAYLGKPFTEDDLVRVIHTYCPEAP